MTNTTLSYLNIVSNLPRMQASTAKSPEVAAATAYYKANIGKVKSISDFTSNYKLLSYALTAYGMEDQLQNKSLIKKVLEGGVKNRKSLANTLNDKRFLAFAKAFDFTGRGVASVSSSAAVAATTSAYTEQKLEDNAGKQNPAVQTALYFKRVAANITDPYTFLGNKQLTNFIETALGLPTLSGADAIDVQASAIRKGLNGMKDLQSPAKVNQLAMRFTALYDLDNNQSNGVADVSTLFNGMASGSTINDTMLASLQSLTLGGT